MKIIGCDLHARQQTLAMLDTTTGEVVKVTLKHTFIAFPKRRGGRRDRTALTYSYRRALIGSTRLARNAGMYPAAQATMANNPVANPSVHGSCASKP